MFARGCDCALAFAGTTILLAGTTMMLASAALAQEGKFPPDRDPGQEVSPRRPGPSEPLKYFPPPIDPAQVPSPAPAAPRESLPVADRWRIMQALGFKRPWFDPYNQNVLKAD
ncbi:MAG: hypothetical protein ACXWF2_02545, partial [Usitatibacter sp.]